MALVPHPSSTEAVFTLVNAIQRQINPSNPAINYPPKGQGTARREARELAKHKANLAADAQRKKAQNAGTSDVTFAELPREDREPEMHGAYVKGARVGTVKIISGKSVLFDNSGKEVSSRARTRDLKKAAAGLYTGPAERQPSRQVRRRLERKEW